MHENVQKADSKEWYRCQTQIDDTGKPWEGIMEDLGL